MTAAARGRAKQSCIAQALLGQNSSPVQKTPRANSQYPFHPQNLKSIHFKASTSQPSHLLSNLETLEPSRVSGCEPEGWGRIGRCPALSLQWTAELTRSGGCRFASQGCGCRHHFPGLNLGSVNQLCDAGHVTRYCVLYSPDRP